MLLINDTNIWIDLKAINLIKEVFSLPYKIGVPNILYNDELKEKDGRLLESCGIIILEMTENEVLETAMRSSQTNRVSFNDLTTLVVAKERGYTLVTGDGNLRKIASKERISLKGTIWLLDEMVEYKVITKEKAAIACQELLKQGRRLPKEELIRRISKWTDAVAVSLDE